MDTTIIVACFLGGIIPAILWLEFWLREATHREPRSLLFLTFLAGMGSILIAGLLEQAVSVNIIEYTTLSFILWAAIEEILKFLAAYWVSLRTRFCDDVIDPTIYMITAALGFAAGENILFLFEPFSDGDFGKGLMTITFRFVGATVLHIIASSLVGLSIGFAFYKSKQFKIISTTTGLILATSLHTAFNSFIISGQDYALWVFGGIWVGLIVIIVILEKIKNTKRIKHTS